MGKKDKKAGKKHGNIAIAIDTPVQQSFSHTLLQDEIKSVVEYNTPSYDVVEVSESKGSFLESKASRVTVASTWQSPPPPNGNYERVSREAYGGNEVVFACIDQLAKSAAEPTIVAYNGKERIEDHPVLDLLRNPNPYMTGYDYLGSLIMYRSLAGNSYTELVYNLRGDKPIELYLIRPDRMTVLSTGSEPVSGYRFTIGNFKYDYRPDEIGHYKIRNPIDSRYGLAPMSVLLSRVDTDNFAREFTKSFFYNSGVPSTLLAFKSILDDQERSMIRDRFRQDYSGVNSHNIMVTEANEVDVKPLGMPMGARGIAYPELDEINEARIAMVFGIPLALIGARLGQKSSSYANNKAAIEMFWNETLVPIYREIEANFNAWLVPHFDDITHIKFDLTSIFAFNDETDVLNARTRNNYTSSMVGWRESRKLIGLVDDPDPEDIILVPTNMRPMKVKDFMAGKSPIPPDTTTNDKAPSGDKPNQNGHNDKPFVAGG